jgi:hypothetical protein
MHSSDRDRGAVDVSVQMLFGGMALLVTLLLVFESAAFWHARNVFDDAAAEGARVAAAYDGDCRAGVAAARTMIADHAGRWGAHAVVTCTSGTTVTVTISGSTPGVLGAHLGFRAKVVESAPKES